MSLPLASAGTIYSGIQNIVKEPAALGSPVSYNFKLDPSQVAPFVFTADYNTVIVADTVTTWSVSLTGTAGSSDYVYGVFPSFVNTVNDAAPLGPGVAIDGTETFAAANDYLLALQCSGKCKKPFNIGGQFSSNTPAYLGVRFTTSGGAYDGTHYGWVQVNVDLRNLDNLGSKVTIHDWAFESDPGVGILTGQTTDATPEPSSLALFAGGAAGLLALRRKRAALKSSESR